MRTARELRWHHTEHTARLLFAPAHAPDNPGTAFTALPTPRASALLGATVPASSPDTFVLLFPALAVLSQLRTRPPPASVQTFTSVWIAAGFGNFQRKAQRHNAVIGADRNEVATLLLRTLDALAMDLLKRPALLLLYYSNY